MKKQTTLTLLVLALSSSVAPAALAQTKMMEATIVLNWFAEPPLGGYYAALKDGLFEAKGVKVTILPGGPNTSGYALLGSGKVQFAQIDSAGILQSREEGLPFVGVFADLQLSPQVLMYHKDNPVKSFKDLVGRQVAVTPGAPFWDYIVAKYDLKGKVQQVNYSGQIASFVSDKKAISQGYAVAEPYNIQKTTGEDIGYLLIGDSGFNPYAFLATTEDYIKTNPAMVKAVVEASQEGWKRYLANPSKYADALKAANPDLDNDFQAWSAKAVVPFVTGKNSDTKKYGLGHMSASRWKTMYEALKQVGVLKKDQDYRKAFTNKFLPKP